MSPTNGKMEEHSPEKLRRFAVRRADNIVAIEYFVAANVILVLTFILFYAVRRIWRASGAGKKRNVGVYALLSLSRAARNVSIRTVPGLPSRGHAALVFIYCSLNIIVMFARLNNSNMAMLTNIASRTAWLAMANTLFTIFLSLKNTPLAWVTDWSYERLNILHQVAGYSAIVHVIIHAGTYTYYFISEDRAAVLRRPSVIAGIAAGFAFLILGVSGVIVRRWWYELFYYLHVFSWVVGIVMLGLHQPELTKKLIYVTIAIAGIWVLDRLIRVSRLLLYSANNSVVLTPLPHGGTRVTLTKSPVAAKSGQHCFLWIPSIRTFETHPFTIASMDPLEFVVASYDGFTGDLHDYAVSNPGISLRASVEGSYGAVPNTARFDKIIFVSGGSGASFTFGMALNALKKMSADCNKELMFIWFIKQRTYCEWFLSQLQTLRADSRVTVRIFATREAGVELGPAETAGRKSISHCVSSDSEGSISPPTPVASCPSSPVSTDTEKAAMCILGRQNDPLSIHDIPVTPGRPDVAVMIDEEMRKSSADQNVLVLGCGPDAMMAQVRNATASCIRPNGPAVELHCEQFGW